MKKGALAYFFLEVRPLQFRTPPRFLTCIYQISNVNAFSELVMSVIAEHGDPDLYLNGGHPINGRTDYYDQVPFFFLSKGVFLFIPGV